MNDLVRKILNRLRLNSPYIFYDGSRMSYHAQFDILRYATADKPPKILDIGLEFDITRRIYHVYHTEIWKWRDPEVPLHTHSELGMELTAGERLDVLQKFREYQQKHPRKFEAL